MRNSYTAVEHGALQEIAKQPQKEEARLIFADFIDEAGDPLAELIRTQCALAVLPESSERVPVLKEKERELLAYVKQKGKWTHDVIIKRDRGLAHVIAPMSYIRHHASKIMNIPLLHSVAINREYTLDQKRNDDMLEEFKQWLLQSELLQKVYIVDLHGDFSFAFDQFPSDMIVGTITPNKGHVVRCGQDDYREEFAVASYWCSHFDITRHHLQARLRAKDIPTFTWTAGSVARKKFIAKSDVEYACSDTLER